MATGCGQCGQCAQFRVEVGFNGSRAKAGWGDESRMTGLGSGGNSGSGGGVGITEPAGPVFLPGLVAPGRVCVRRLCGRLVRSFGEGVSVRPWLVDHDLWALMANRTTWSTKTTLLALTARPVTWGGQSPSLRGPSPNSRGCSVTAIPSPWSPETSSPPPTAGLESRDTRSPALGGPSPIARGRWARAIPTPWPPRQPRHRLRGDLSGSRASGMIGDGVALHSGSAWGMADRASSVMRCSSAAVAMVPVAATSGTMSQAERRSSSHPRKAAYAATA